MISREKSDLQKVIFDKVVIAILQTDNVYSHGRTLTRLNNFWAFPATGGFGR